MVGVLSIPHQMDKMGSLGKDLVLHGSRLSKELLRMEQSFCSALGTDVAITRETNRLNHFIFPYWFNYFYYSQQGQYSFFFMSWKCIIFPWENPFPLGNCGFPPTRGREYILATSFSPLCCLKHNIPARFERVNHCPVMATPITTCKHERILCIGLMAQAPVSCFPPVMNLQLGSNL